MDVWLILGEASYSDDISIKMRPRGATLVSIYTAMVVCTALGTLFVAA